VLHQLVEAAAFHDATLLEDEDAAGIADGGQPMRDDEGGTPLHHLVERRVHLHLGHGIERACGFVKNEDRRIFQKRARDREPLTLSARQIPAALSDYGIKAAFVTLNEIERLRSLAGFENVLVGGVGIAHA
jgi:hypothetical protein